MTNREYNWKRKEEVMNLILGLDFFLLRILNYQAEIHCEVK